MYHRENYAQTSPQETCEKNPGQTGPRSGKYKFAQVPDIHVGPVICLCVPSVG